MNRVVTTAASLLLVLAVAACAPRAGTGNDFRADLSGDEEVPAVATTGMGASTATLDPETMTLNVTGTFSGLSAPASAAHIHAGRRGENGDVVFPLVLAAEGDGTSGTLEGEFTLTPEQVDTLRSGGYYVNVHTPNNPGGEIRGQLR